MRGEKSSFREIMMLLLVRKDRLGSDGPWEEVVPPAFLSS